jgi:glycosyltransferase involved in cell wall biosynthesis
MPEPRVTVAIPALDEAAHIEATVASVLQQDVDGGLEVLVVDGGSTDGTQELAERAGATVLENPRKVIPAALNIALEAARGDVLIRLDGHSEMPPGYIAAALRALDAEDGAVNVGGWLVVGGTGPWSLALGAALGSAFGIGNPRLWRRPNPGAPRMDVDTVPFGAYRVDALRAAGGWNETLATNEDYELNYRLRRAGGRIVFDPEMWTVYRPRESLPLIARQYWRYGSWKAVMLANAPGSIRPRQVAPVLLLATFAAALPGSPVARPATAVVVVYGSVVAAVAARSEAGWRTAPLLLTMHVAWGSALVAGLARAALSGRRPSRSR